MGGKSKDLTGMFFGEWEVIEFRGTNKWNSKQYLCRCSCGKEQIIDGSTLRKGQTKQCKDCKNAKQIKDLTNKVFGDLTVVRFLRTENGKAMWECKCKCGNIIEVRGCDLTREDGTRQCRNCASTKIATNNRNNILGNRYGRLVVIDYGYSDGDSYFWKCKCDCGEIIYVRAYNLINGITNSCGCIAKERIAELGRQQKGENSPRWNADLTQEEREQERLIDGYKEWGFEIKKQYNFTCDICGDNRGGNLISHHLDGYNWCKDKRIDITNGVCLCEKCHKEFHKKYGYGDNTKQQYIEFKENKLTKQEQ